MTFIQYLITSIFMAIFYAVLGHFSGQNTQIAIIGSTIFVTLLKLEDKLNQ